MSWTVVQSVFHKSTFALPSATFAAPMTAGNLLVVFYYGAITGSSVLNTTAYALVSQNGPGGSTATQYGQTRTIQSGDGAAILAPSNDSTQICYVMAIELHHSSGLQAFDAGAHQISSAPVVGPTTAANDEIALMSSASGSGFGVYAPASGWTNDQTDGSGTTTLDHLAVLTSGTPTTGSPSWTVNGTSAHWMVLTFKPGTNVETGTGKLAFTGATMSGVGIVKHHGVASMAFRGAAFLGGGFSRNAGLGGLHFGGIAVIARGGNLLRAVASHVTFALQNAQIQPLTWNVPIVDSKTGGPTPEFQRKWQKQFSILEAQQKTNAQIVSKAYVDQQISAALGVAQTYADTAAAAVVRITLVAASNINGGAAVKITSAGLMDLPSQTALADGLAVVGVSVGAVLAGVSGPVQISGALFEPSWAWTPGQAVYVADAGLLTQAVPAGKWLLQIGEARDTNTLVIQPRIVISTPL